MSKNRILFLFLVCLISCNKRPPYKTGFEGKPIPAFDLLSADSSRYMNTANISFEKPVVFFSFSPSCPYCAAEMTDIIENMASLKDIQFYIFTPWPYSTFKQFYAHYQLRKYLNIIAAVDDKNFFGDYYKIPVVPITAIYGRDRKLIAAYLGNLSAKQIRNNIRE